MKKTILFLLITSCLIFISIKTYNVYFPGEANIISVKMSPQKVNISFYWKQSNGVIYSNIRALKSDLQMQNKKLIFATNGGMFDEDFGPIGLYIENSKEIRPLNTKSIIPKKNKSIPNFYLNPNGVFFIKNDGIAGICKTSSYTHDSTVKFATQSGPMLLVDGEINPIFSQNSNNFNIRNGVGILPNKELIFAISKNQVTFFDFAKYFKEQGCINALFLDGFVSKAFMPDKKIEQLDGKLGVLIGVTEK